MIVNTTLRFRARREPFPYDMTAQGGSVGTSYSFDAIDDDDCKVKVKCSEQVWLKLEDVPRDTPLQVSLEVGNPKIASGSQVIVGKPGQAPARPAAA